MGEFLERRRVPRVAVANDVTVRVRASLLFDVRLLDLSLIGARIAHLDLLRPGSPSVLDFPATLGPLTLAAQIARSCIVGTQPNLFGERQLCYESGLAFLEVRPEQQVKLADILERLTRIRGGEVSWQEVREYPGAVIWVREVRAGWWAVATTSLPALAGNGSGLALPSAEMILPAGYESHTAAVEAAKKYLDREHARCIPQPSPSGGAVACILPRAVDRRWCLGGAGQLLSHPDERFQGTNPSNGGKPDKSLSGRNDSPDENQADDRRTSI